MNLKIIINNWYTIIGRSRVATLAILLGLLSVCSAFLIGLVAYRTTFRASEQSHQQFYLNQARLLSRAAGQLAADRSEAEVLSLLWQLWHGSGSKPADEYICIVDSGSVLLLHSAAPTTVGNFAGDNKLLGVTGTGISCLSDLARVPRDYVGEYISSSGENQIAAFVGIPGRNWVLGVHRSRTALQSQIRADINYLKIGFIIFTVLLLPVSLLLLFGLIMASQKRVALLDAEHQASEKQFKVYLDKLPVAIAISDEQNRVEFLNSTFTTVFGYTRRDIPTTGKWWELAYPDQQVRERVIATWNKAISETAGSARDIGPISRTITAKNGDLLDIEVTSTRIGQKFLIVFNNITNRRLIEVELQHLNQELERKIFQRTIELQAKIDELERFREATVDRELKMEQLRERIRRFEDGTGNN
ncbi:MAG: PAS domain-containing protein [Candidatus Neomarinimicrobiota bacterium]